MATIGPPYRWLLVVALATIVNVGYGTIFYSFNVLLGEGADHYAALRQVFEPDTFVTVSWTGGLSSAKDLMLEPFKQHVAEMWSSARLLAPEGKALQGAALLAQSNQILVFGSQLHVFDR